MPPVDRREFLRGCIVAMSLAVHPPARARTPDVDLRVLPADTTDARLGTSTLSPHEPYCFFCSYVSTPGPLLDMGARARPVEAAPDDWRRGGARRAEPGSLPARIDRPRGDEPTDALFAAGVRGPDSFDRFFAAFDRDRRSSSDWRA
jgi:hypothetical protein